MVVLPHLKRGYEKGRDDRSSGTFRFGQELDEPLLAFIIRKVEWEISELAHVGRACAHLCLFVDDRAVVLRRRGREHEFGPAVFGRIQSAQMVLYGSGSDLRFEGINEELWMAVEQSLGGVTTVLVHGRDHEQAELLWIYTSHLLLLRI